MQHTRSHPSTCGGVTCYTVAGSYIGVSAVIYIEQRTLCAFKQQIGTLGMGNIEFARYIGHHGFEQFGMLHGLCVYSVKLYPALLHKGLQSRAEIKMFRTQIGG